MTEPILITGADGFIGTNLVKYFNQIKPPKWCRDNLVLVGKMSSFDHMTNLIGCDYKEYYDYRHISPDEVVRREVPHVIVHLGAHSSTALPDDMIGVQYYRDNVTSTHAYLQALGNVRKHGTFINASSASVYGKRQTFEEEAPLAPVTLYGETKRQAEALVEHTPYTLKTYNLRFFNVYGPFELHKPMNSRSPVFNIGVRLRKFLERENIIFHTLPPEYANKQKDTLKALLDEFGPFSIYGGGRDILKALPTLYSTPFLEPQGRDFVYVGDVVRTIVDFIEDKDESKIPYGTYNVGLGRSSTWEGVVDACQRVATDYVGFHNNFILSGRLMDFFKIPRKQLPLPKYHTYQPYTCANTDKLRMHVTTKDFTPIEEGIRKTFNHIFKGELEL